MASSSDLDLQCFQKRINPGSAGQGLSGEENDYSSFTTVNLDCLGL